MLAVGLDALTFERLREMTEGSGLLPAAASPTGAFEQAASPGGTLLVLLGWQRDHEREMAQFCMALRRASRGRPCRVVAVCDVAEREPPPCSAGRGVDDVLLRPFGRDIVARLRRVLEARESEGQHQTPQQALEESLEERKSGEVVVRSGGVSGVIHVQDGHVVWAHLSSEPTSMREVVSQAGVDLDQHLISAITEECRMRGAHFMDVLVSWGVLDEARGREAIREHVAGRVRLILELPDAVGMFLPRSRRDTARHRFRTSELPVLRAPSEPPESAELLVAPRSERLAPMPLLKLAELVRSALSMRGALGAAVFDRKTGVSLLFDGDNVDADIVWTQLTLLSALGPGAEDVMAVANDFGYLLRPLKSASSLALFVVVSLSATTVGLARARLGVICASYPRGEASMTG